MLNLLAEGAIPLDAEKLPMMSSSWGVFASVFTNSIVVAFIVAALVIWFARRATRKMELVPTRASQNTFEAVVEALYDMLEGIVGRHMIAKAFPLLATLFIFILTANWFGLLPGVGTIGFGEGRGPLLSLQELNAPLLRPASADLNLTLAMALFFTVYWAIWSFQELGVGGFFSHIFGSKGNVSGFLKYILAVIFFLVGVIEVVSIVFRPVSLSLRLFGNVFAGENLMHTMANLGQTLGLPSALAYLLDVLAPVPFYFLELLVGVVQALVFTLLCSVYLKLTTSHDEGHGEEHAAHDDHAAHPETPAAVPVPAH